MSCKYCRRQMTSKQCLRLSLLLKMLRMKHPFTHVSSHLPDLGLNLTAEVEGSWARGGNPTEWGWREFKLPRRPLVTCFLSLFGSSVIYLGEMFVWCQLFQTSCEQCAYQCSLFFIGLWKLESCLLRKSPTWSGVQGVNWSGRTG